MKKILLTSIILLLTTGALLPANTVTNIFPILKTKGQNIAAFVPAGWKLVKQTSGDINRDGLIDIAGVLELNKSYNPRVELAPPRILFIALKKPNGLYHLLVQSNKAILKADEGGIWGDPFDSIAVKNGTFIIYFYGGSNHRWSLIYTFKFQKNSMYLVEAEKVNYFNVTGEGTKINYYLLTGIMLKSTIKHETVLKTEKINRGIKTIKLENFNATPDGTVF
jgi:hypothetical protein